MSTPATSEPEVVATAAAMLRSFGEKNPAALAAVTGKVDLTAETPCIHCVGAGTVDFGTAGSRPCGICGGTGVFAPAKLLTQIAADIETIYSAGNRTWFAFNTLLAHGVKFENLPPVFAASLHDFPAASIIHLQDIGDMIKSL